MYIGIDLGGSHIGIGLVSKDYKIINKKEVDISEFYEKENIVSKCKNMISDILNEQKLSIYQIDSIGIGAPGQIRGDIIISSPNMRIYNFNIINEFRKNEDYKSIPIYLENDANCATIAEYLCGSLKNVTNGVMLTIGTGIGSGIIINQKLYKGSNLLAGEIGHMCISHNGLECKCGQKGCFEVYASMKNLRKKITEQLQLNKEITGEEIQILLNNGNEIVKKTFLETLEYLAIGIANCINIFDPQKIVLGGSIVYYKQWIFDKLNYLVNQKVFNKSYNAYIIEFATVGNNAGIIGAAFAHKMI